MDNKVIKQYDSNQVKPIFVCGYIKSGTSLLISLLDNHSELFAFPEEMFLFYKFNDLEIKKKIKVSDFWDYFFSDIQIQRFYGGVQKGVFGNVDYNYVDGEKFEQLCRKRTKDIQLIKGNEKILFETIFITFINVINKSDTKRWVEKTPTNERNFEKWYEWYPQAKFIYLKRDPFEVYAAIKRKREKANINYSIIHFLANYNISYEKAKFLEKHFPDNFIIIDFEKLAKNKKYQMRELCRFLEIAYEPTLLDPTKNGEPWLGNSMFRKNESEKVENDDLREKRLATLTPLELKLIDEVIVNKNISWNNRLYLLKSDWKSYIKARYPNLFLKLEKSKIRAIYHLYVRSSLKYNKDGGKR